MVIPDTTNYNRILKHNYGIKYLKDICRHYKLKISGNKTELNARIYNHLHLSYFANKIQRWWRSHLCSSYDRIHGPARINRKICVNETDFYSMESLENISYNQFYSFKDVDNMIYGFDILSLHNLFSKGGRNTTNPYNRKNFPVNVKPDVDKLVRLSKMVGTEINITIEKEEIDPEKQLELRSLALFLYMDDLGNYTDPIWFWSLDREQIVRFIRELFDIWTYRSQMEIQIKLEICPPVGDPFSGININYLNNKPLAEIRKLAIDIMENCINRGVDMSSRCLGVNFVLCALTLVNDEAALALPWLFQSVSQI
jgi:hypothetical protein